MAESVENARLLDGNRCNAYMRMTGWRRSAPSPRLWNWGRVDISPDDVVFRDHAQQPTYKPPAPDQDSQLERDLVGCSAFTEALADYDFAVIAYRMLSQLVWLKVGNREASQIDGSRSAAGLIADLRGKGEEYLDYYVTSDEHKISKSLEARHAGHVYNIMRSLGWRTYSPDELKALAYESFKTRIARRLHAWNRIGEYEQRPANAHVKLEKTLLIDDMFLLDGDDPSWLEELKADERIAISAEYPRRLLALALAGKITEDEYFRLFDALL